jgi:hypothetical protein
LQSCAPQQNKPTATRDGLERFVFKAVPERGLDKEEGVMNSFVANLRRIMWRPTVLAVAGTAALCATETVRAQADQRLDGVVVFGETQAQGVVQTPVLKKVHYTSDPVTGMPAAPIAGTHALKSCQGTGTRGLYCVDHDAGNSKYAVLRWKDPDNSTAVQEEIDCDQLGLDSCTALTVTLRGHIFVAGQKTATNPNSYSLFKLIEKVGVEGRCPGEDSSESETTDEWNTTADDRYCFREFASNRPRIYDLKMIDGELSGYFMGQGRGVLALEDPAPGQVTFYADRQPPASPIVYVQANQWGSNNLAGGTVQGLTLLQYAGFAEPRNYILVTTSTGKVLGYRIPWSSNSSVFDTGLLLNSTSMAVTTGTACTAGGSSFDLSASARTRRVFFASNTCVAAYDPVLSTRSNARVPITFETKSFGIASNFSLAGVAVSAGIEIDFVRDGCTSDAGCTLLKDGGDSNNFDAARFAKIKLVNNGATGWVMYHVTGLLDCRFVSIPRPAICATAVVNPDGSIDTDETAGTFEPWQQYLDVEDLLPPEVKDAVELPSQMLLQPDYSAPKSSDYTFAALFGVPEEGLTYRGTFDGSFDIGDLIGSSLGCGGGTLPANATSAPKWEVVVNISELAPTVGGPIAVTFPEGNPPATVPREFVSVLLNKEPCTNPTALAGTRGSGFFFGLQRAPQARDANGNWIWYDSTFALLMRSLARDFDTNLYTYTCRNLDAPTGSLAPLDAATCTQLKKDWVVTYDKFKNCIDATDQPKNSSGSEGCGAFETQWTAFKTYVAGVTLQAGAPDPQNRVGGLINAMLVMDYVYKSQFLTSLKRRGFENPNVVN